ncbi:HtaA domain-containing protein [Conexibacter arvalis]|uniref:Htaa domain-containing protein n=1 Tax=Conexibacter arvalis TaxID=912552 RepID=A0A840IJF1_9ACTN|nr:HtaA domain-containing protein [Conexibacter arvalis]MBB4664058.1 hypothetical protein [Conexibacter arvalis]
MPSLHLPSRRGSLALAVLVAALALAASCASGARAAQTPIASGAGLDWGLKESWRNYIGEAGTSVSAGATRNPDGTFHFPVRGGSYDDVTRNTTVQFGGTVQFLSHCAGGVATRPCELDLTMADPRVEITEDGAFLYAKMTSRPITGGEIVDYPQVKVAELDVEEAVPAVDGGTTRWAGLPATVAEEGAAVFTYSVGTVIDPVTFAYDGPGGKPAGETWATPGTIAYATSPLASTAGATIKWTQPGRTAGERLAIYGQDSSGFALVDAATFAVKPGTRIASSDAEPQSVAFDPATATIFSTGTGANVPIVVRTWDGSAWTGGPIAGSEVAHANGFDVGGGVWDAAGRRYLLPRVVGGVQQLWEVRQVGGVWTHSVIGPIRGGNGLPLPVLVDLEAIPNGSTSSSYIVAADADGGPLRRLHVVDGVVIAEPLQQARGATARALAKTNGGLYVIGASELTFLPIRWNSLLAAETPAVDIAAAGALAGTIYGTTAVDAARDRLYLARHDRQAIMRFDAGVLTHSFAGHHASGPMRYWSDFLVGATTDGRLVHSVAGVANDGSPNADAGLYARAYASRTPSFTTQPRAQPAVLREAGQPVPATISAVVDGDPAPALRWQTRAPGQSRWSDLADGDGVSGAATATLTFAAGAGDNGRQFRAIASNAGGEVASARVAFEVHTPPQVSVEPDDVAVVAGTPAQLKVMPLGNPAPTVTWQQQIDGFWREVDARSGDFDVDGGFLTVVDPNVAMSGARFRAKLENAAGVRFSRAVTLSVHRAITTAVTFGGGHVDWGVSNRWRCYVVGNISRGGIEVSGGATQIPGTLASGDLCRGREAGSESLRFPVQGGVYDPASGRLEVTLGGAVRFWGHDYHVPGSTTPQLDTTFSNLRVVVEGEVGTLYADVVGATMENPTSVTRLGVALARLDAAGSSLVPTADGAAWSSLPAVLTADGAPVFGSYHAGEPLDALSLSLVYGTPKTVEPPTPAPPHEEPPTPAPPVARPAAAARVTAVRGVRRVGAKRRAAVATIVCPAGGACRVTTPKSVVARIGGKRFKLAVVAPKTIKAGKRATVRVRLSKRAVQRLRGRKATVRVKTTVVTGGKRTTRTVKATIAAKKIAKRKAARR